MGEERGRGKRRRGETVVAVRGEVERRRGVVEGWKTKEVAVAVVREMARNGLVLERQDLEGLSHGRRAFWRGRERSVLSTWWRGRRRWGGLR